MQRSLYPKFQEGGGMMDNLLLTGEEMEIAVNKWRNEDWATRYVRLNRGHYEDILPVIAQAQLDKIIRAIDECEYPMCKVRQALKKGE